MESSSELVRWMIAGIEKSKVLREIKAGIYLVHPGQCYGPDLLHHEQLSHLQAILCFRI